MQTTLQAINQATAYKEPFSFIQFQNVFPETLYKDLCASLVTLSPLYPLPHPDALRADGSSTREVWELTPSSINQLESTTKVVWTEVMETLTASAFRRILFQKLSYGLAKRLELSEESVKDYIAYPRLLLVKDSADFKILPHPDIAEKLVTVQFYLTQQTHLQGWGTHLYKNHEEPFFTPAYLPNTGYAFVVDSHSWHARSPIPQSPHPRFTLSVTFYLKPPIPVEMEKMR